MKRETIKELSAKKAIRLVKEFKGIELVRCKNCKHHGGNEYYIMCDKLGREVEPDWYCADGEAKDDD